MITKLDRVLTPEQGRTLDAVARRLVPPAYSGEFSVADFTEQLTGRIARLPAHKRRDLRLVIALIGGRLAALATVGRARSFAQLPTALQDRFLQRWSTARIPLCRTAYQAVRRITMAEYYSTTGGQRLAAYLGPYHSRRPSYPWEGPVGSAADDRENESLHGRVSHGRPSIVPDPADDDAVVVRGRTSATEPLVGRGSPPNIEDIIGGAPDHHPLFAAPTAESQHFDGTVIAAAQTVAAVRMGADSRLHAAPSIGRGAKLDGGRRESASVIVIGTGAGGAVVSALLAEAGEDVVMVEAGGSYAGAQFTERESEMTEQLYADAGARATEDLSVAILQGEVVGGGTAINWMVMLRTPDHVLDEWTRRHGAVGLTSADLLPRFEQVERDVHSRPVPRDAHSPNNRIILDGAQQLGWHAFEASINARGCLRTGFCGQGCRYDAKQGAHLTYVPRAVRAGARLLPRTRVDRVSIVERGGRRALKRVHATVSDPVTGRRSSLTIEAPTVIVAAGAIETPALLQRSGMGGGGVGRYLRLHPTTAIIGIYDRPIYAAAGIPLSAVCDEFSHADANGYGFWIECPPLHPGLAAVAAPGFGESHASMMRQFTNLGALIALVRDGADRDTSNGSVKVDRRGVARINYRMGPRDSAHMCASIVAAARLHLAQGAHEVRTLHARPTVAYEEADLASFRDASMAPNDLAIFSAHVNGSCRIGTHPGTSGVSPDFERHGFPGVFVCDGSLLPTAPGVNPQETIMAMAMVVAQRILDL